MLKVKGLKEIDIAGAYNYGQNVWDKLRVFM